jgi:hypothetical protein
MARLVKNNFLDWASEHLPEKCRGVIAWRILSKAAQQQNKRAYAKLMRWLLKSELASGEQQPLMTKAQLLDELDYWWENERPYFDSEREFTWSSDAAHFAAARAEVLQVEGLPEEEIEALAYQLWLLQNDMEMAVKDIAFKMEIHQTNELAD